MKTTEKPSFIMPAAILDLGRMVSARSGGLGCGSEQVSSLLSEVASMTTRLLEQIRASADRKLFGIHQSHKGDDDEIRLRIIAFLAWQDLALGYDSIPLTEVANACMTICVDSQCQHMLIARDCLGRMIVEDLIKLIHEDKTHWSARFFLPPNTVSYLCGGAASKGDFLPSKLFNSGRDKRAKERNASKSAKAELLTAKELYEKVRMDVIGIDPQVRALASRFALHVARAEALKSGVDDNTVGQMVVCLIGSSGASKTYLASKMASASGLPFVQFDATTLTASGYIGSDVDDIYKSLVNGAGGDTAVASRGVCFLDEFDKKSTRYARDVGGEAIQMELLSKLQASATPFIVGGKRSGDFGRQFQFDGRPTGYILAGVFKGLDEEIEKMSGRRGIGFASHVGSSQHVRVADCLKEFGFLDELVNRIGLVMRLPDPTIENVMLAISGNILDGFNAVLEPRHVYILLTSEAIFAIAEYAMATRGFYRSAKSVMATLVEDIMFDATPGRTVVLNDDDVRRAIGRLSSGFFMPDDAGLMNPSETQYAPLVDVMTASG